MDKNYIGKLILGSTLTKIIYLFSEDGPTREYFPIDRIRSDTGGENTTGFVIAHAGDEKISLYIGDGPQVQADIWGNNALKLIRKIQEEYLPAHYPGIKIFKRTIVTTDPEITKKNHYYHQSKED